MTERHPNPWGPPKGASPRPWTEADIRRLRGLVHRGWDDDAIAEDLDRTGRAVAIKRSRLGLVVRELPRGEGRTPRERVIDLRTVSTQELIAELTHRGFTFAGSGPT